MSKQTKKTGDIINVPEIKLTYDPGNFVTAVPKISQAEDAVNVLRGLYNKEEIELHEILFVIYLNRSNKPIGYYRHTIGGIASTVVDITLILATALKSLASGILVSHNHPGGGLRPSDGDLSITRELASAAKLLKIQLLDHIIMTKDSYHSFANEGLMGFNSKYPELPENLILNDSSGLNMTFSASEKKARKIESELRKL